MKKTLFILFVLISSCSINQEEDLKKTLKVTDSYYGFVENHSYEGVLNLFENDVFKKMPKDVILKNLNEFNLRFGNYNEHKLTNYAPIYHGSKLINMKLEFEVSYDKIKTIEQFSLKCDEKDRMEIISYNLLTIDSSKK